MRKLCAVLFGLMMLAVSANAQSANEIYASFGKLPTEAEIVAEVKASASFADRIKALEGPISKLEKTEESNESEESEDESAAAALAMIANSRQKMMSDPDGWAAEMEKRAALQEKMTSLIEFQSNLMNLNRKYVNMLEELEQANEDDSAYNEKVSQLQNKYKMNNLDNVNQYYKDIYALDCEVSSKKINKRMDVIRKYYDELIANKAQIIELCEVTDEFYKLSGIDMTANNPARITLIEFAKLYKRVLEEGHPNSLVQYKSMKEYYESLG